MRSFAMAVAAGVALTACSGGSAPGGVVSGAGPPGAVTSVAGGAPVADSSPPVADSPAALATLLAAVETAIRDPSTPPPALDGLGREEQGLYGQLLRHPDWQAAVVATVPARVRPAVEANLTAGTELAKLSGTPGAELPHWRIVPPAPSEELLGYYKSAGTATGVPWQYLAAIHLVETRMGRIKGDSSAGAQGPMQFIPSTWAIYGKGGDISSNRDAIPAAARMLRSRGAPADMAGALHAYNPSNRYVSAVSAYARVIAADERSYAAYRGWQVYYGDRLLPEGWVG